MDVNHQRRRANPINQHDVRIQREVDRIALIAKRDVSGREFYHLKFCGGGGSIKKTTRQTRMSTEAGM